MLARVIAQFTPGAKTIDQSLSIAPATNDPVFARQRATPVLYEGRVSTSGVLIPAPPAGQQIAIVDLVLQSTTVNDSVAIIRDQATGGTVAWEIPCPVKGAGIDKVYGVVHPRYHPDAKAIYLDLSNTDPTFISIRYIVVDTATKRPI